jgi:hypothetical protein
MPRILSIGNCFVAHLYHTSLDALATWYLQHTPSVMREIHQCDELRPLDLLHQQNIGSLEKQLETLIFA